MMNCKMIEEARSTGRGNNIFLEIVKACLVFLGATLISQLLSAVVITVLGGADDGLFSTLGFFWGEAFGIAAILLYCRFCEKRTVQSVGFTRKDWWKDYLRGLGTGFGMISAVVLVGTALGAFQFVGFSDSFNPLMLLLFGGGFMIQGMFEEVVCRGYMMVSMARKNSVIVAVICNSLIFTLLHIGNDGFGIIPFINLTLFGIFASTYMLKSGNIWAVGALHTVWNFSQGCFYGLSVSGLELLPSVFTFKPTDNILANGGTFGPEGGYVVTIVITIELIVLLYSTRITKQQSKM